MEGRRGIGPPRLFELGRVADAKQKHPPLRDESLRGSRIDARDSGVRLGQHLLHGT